MGPAYIIGGPITPLLGVPENPIDLTLVTGMEPRGVALRGVSNDSFCFHVQHPVIQVIQW